MEGPSKAEVTCHDNKDGTMSVIYVPPSPGEYKVSIKAGDKHIRGSPFTAKITGNKCSVQELLIFKYNSFKFPEKKI